MTDLLALSADLPMESTVADGEVAHRGRHADRRGCLVLGRAQLVIEHDGVPFARVDTPGAVFGEMSVVLDRPATATVRAAATSRCGPSTTR